MRQDYGKCEVCKKKLNEQDYAELCTKCQPAWRAGYLKAKEDMLYIIQNNLEGLDT